MSSAADFTTGVTPTWCPGCGDFAIWLAMKNAFVQLGLNPHEVLSVYGIGCSGNMTNFVRTYGFHALHGRGLPVATAAKLLNHKLNVVCVSGDGDCYGIGMGHFIHAARRNINLALLVCNNEVYGLTTGQTSPTSEKGYKSKSTPHGVIEMPVNPLALALSSDATFIARAFSGDVPHLTDIVKQAITHRGFAVVDVLQPCVTFNKINTYEWFRARAYYLGKNEPYDPSNKDAAWQKCREWEEKIPLGVLYKTQRPTYEDELQQLQNGPVVRHSLDGIDVTPLMEGFV